MYEPQVFSFKRMYQYQIKKTPRETETNMVKWLRINTADVTSLLARLLLLLLLLLMASGSPSPSWE